MRGTVRMKEREVLGARYCKIEGEGGSKCEILQD